MMLTDILVILIILHDADINLNTITNIYNSPMILDFCLAHGKHEQTSLVNTDPTNARTSL